MPHKYLDKLYSKRCKIYKAYLTSRRENFVLTHREIITFDFLECLIL